MGEGRRSEMWGGGCGWLRMVGGTEARGDTMKRSQGGSEIRNGRVLANWGENGGVRAREGLKKKFADALWTFA